MNFIILSVGFCKMIFVYSTGNLNDFSCLYNNIVLQLSLHIKICQNMMK
jgi:hypothetical protein